MTSTFEGPVMVIANEALLNAEAVLVECGGFWGGFIEMRSVAGAELVMEAHMAKRFLTFDAENPYAFTPRRTNEQSPVVRITGLGKVPFGKGTGR